MRLVINGLAYNCFVQISEWTNYQNTFNDQYKDERMIPSKDTDDFKLWSEPEKLKGKKDHHQIQTIQIIIRIP